MFPGPRSAVEQTADTRPSYLYCPLNSSEIPCCHALAQQNSCEYCLSAHTAIGRKAGLNGAEIEANRAGTSQDAKAAVAVKFARSLVANMGEVTTAELIEMREAGYSESDIVEVITHVGMNILTNLLGKAGRVDIDFPKVELKLAA